MATVKLRITPDALRALLRFPPDCTITSAWVESVTVRSGVQVPLLVFDVDMPSAPKTAVEVIPAYRRRSNTPDPVELREVCWTHDDGSHTVTACHPDTGDNDDDT